MQLLSPSPALGASWANTLGSLLPSQFATSSRDVPFHSGEVTPLSGSAAALLVQHQWIVLSDFLGSALIVFVYVVLFFFVFIVLYFLLYYFCIYNYLSELLHLLLFIVYIILIVVLYCIYFIVYIYFLFIYAAKEIMRFCR